MSNWPFIAREFNQACAAVTCSHVPSPHAWCQGSDGSLTRCPAAQAYPWQFCETFARIAQEQMLNGWLTPAADSEIDVEMPQDQNY